MALTIAIIALLVAAFAAFTSWRQLSEVRKANSFPAVVDLFREYRTSEMVAARRLLSEKLPHIDPPCAIHDLPDDLADAALRVMHYLDNLGVMLHHGLVEPEIVSGFLGGSAARIWRELSGFIVRERASRPNGVYVEYFEHLVATLKVYRPEDARSGLRKLPPIAD